MGERGWWLSFRRQSSRHTPCAGQGEDGPNVLVRLLLTGEVEHVRGNVRQRRCGRGGRHGNLLRPTHDSGAAGLLTCRVGSPTRPRSPTALIPPNPWCPSRRRRRPPVIGCRRV